jgi:hypothetical protein
MGSLPSRKIHLRTLTGRRYNYCGPNTRLQRRMTLNRTIRDESEPINRIDEISMRHDLDYKDADEGRGTRLEADEAMLRELEQIDDADLSCDELMAKCFTRCIIGLLYSFCRSATIVVALRTSWSYFAATRLLNDLKM